VSGTHDSHGFVEQCQGYRGGGDGTLVNYSFIALAAASSSRLPRLRHPGFDAIKVSTLGRQPSVDGTTAAGPKEHDPQH
jgi:hypothetical protein